MSPIKRIQSSVIPFNTTLRMNIEKSLLQHPPNPKVLIPSSFQCRILLHLIRQNRDKKVIGIATVDIIKENNQGFRYHQFGQCADCEADIEVSITLGMYFELGVRSQIAFFNSSDSQFHDGKNLEQSRGLTSFGQDSIFEGQDFQILKQSKAISSIEPYTMVRPQRRSLKLKPRKNKDIKKLRKAKPENFSSCAPEEIITHYETEIKTFEEELIERDEWATGMKLLIQELEAQNQLLKEITIEQMEAQNIQNLEKGIQYVSTLVHSKFQASRSMIYESRSSQERKGLQSTDNELREMQIENEKSLQPTKSFNNLPQSQCVNLVENSPQKSQIFGNLPVLESRQQLENALKILTGEDRSLQATQQLKIKISQLEEVIFTLKQQKQSLYDSTEELYSELKTLQLQRDSLFKDVRSLQKELQRMEQYIEQIKSENSKIKEKNQRYQNNSKNQEFQKLQIENQSLYQKCRELQRQLKESLKAIEEFKNDALNARSEIITKEDELNCYRLKFGQLGSLTDVYVNNNKKDVSRKPSLDEKKLTGSGFFEHVQKKVESTTASSANLHSLYSHILESSIFDRKELQHSYSQFIGEKSNSGFQVSENSIKREQGLKNLQTKVNRMFVEILKTSNKIVNIKQIEKAKIEVGKQIEEIVNLN